MRGFLIVSNSLTAVMVINILTIMFRILIDILILLVILSSGYVKTRGEYYQQV